MGVNEDGLASSSSSLFGQENRRRVMRVMHVKWHLLVILHDTVCSDMCQRGARKWKNEAHKTSTIYIVTASSYDIVMDPKVIHRFSTCVRWSAVKGEHEG